MEKFNKIIKELDALTTIIDNPNWISSATDSTDILTKIIEQEERVGNIRKGQTVIDLGSGNGAAAFIWAHKGYNTIGIEADFKLYRISKEIQEKYPELKKLNVKIFNGSYYPIEYTKTEKTRKLEQRLLKEFHNTRQYIVSFKDTIYEDNNIDIKNIDIFYAYAWSFQFPSIFEMFYKHARNDAKLIAIGPGRDAILSQYKELERKYNSILKKTTLY